MAIRKMPDWMMDYVASIGLDSFKDYRDLSSRYHSEVKHYLEVIYPTQAGNADMGKPEPKPDNWGAGIDNNNVPPNALPALHLIDERYKREALGIACKYGYEKPSPTVGKDNERLTQLQEVSPEFSQRIKEYIRDLSNEDMIAYQAHKDYLTKRPDVAKNHKTKKEEFRELEWDEQHSDPFTQPYVPDDDKMKNESLADSFINSLSSSKRDQKKDISPQRNIDKEWEL